MFRKTFFFTKTSHFLNFGNVILYTDYVYFAYKLRDNFISSTHLKLLLLTCQTLLLDLSYYAKFLNFVHLIIKTTFSLVQVSNFSTNDIVCENPYQNIVTASSNDAFGSCT